MSEELNHMKSEVLKKYLAGTLIGQERAHFEETMDMDSFEKEALEGFNSMEDKVVLLAAVKSIEKIVAQKTGMKQEGSLIFPIWKIMSIAASAALLILGVFAMSRFTKSEHQVAVNVSSKEHTDLAIFEEEILLNTVEFLSDAEDEPISESLEQTEPPLQQDFKAPDNDLYKLEALIDKPVNESKKREKEEVLSPKPSISLKDKTELKLELSQSAFDTTTSSKQSAALLSASELEAAKAVGDSYQTTSNFEIGKANYDGKDYNQAINYFQQAINNDVNVTESEYYVAMSYYGMKKLNKALKYFDTVISKSPAPLSNNAKWHKSLILEGKGSKDESIKLLKELANGNSGFKNQARDKLNAMN
jgi:tetratricopeptide (TPR) repeat protein